MAGENGQPALTSKRIGELRTALADCFRKLKRGYYEACSPGGDSEARARANSWIDSMRKAMLEAIEEYNGACIPTRSEEYAANELLSEIKVYQDALDNEYVPLMLANDDLRTSPIPSAPGAPATSGRLLPTEPCTGREEEDVAECAVAS